MQRPTALGRRAALAALGALLAACSKDEAMSLPPASSVLSSKPPTGAVDRACYACRRCGTVLFDADEILERRPLWDLGEEKNEVFVLSSASGLPRLRRYDASLHEGWYCCRFAVMRMVVDKFGTGDHLLAYVNDVARVEPGEAPKPDGDSHSGQTRVSAADFDDVVMRDHGDFLSIVKLSATWCPPCRMVDKVIARISEQGDLPDVQFFEADVDAEPALAERFEIQSLPTLLFFYRGKELRVPPVYGAVRERDLVALAGETLAAARVR
ncbi:MAG: thioredoxin family protein [Polyangiaceae bacterium]